MPPACDPVRAAITAYRDGGKSPERSAEAATHLQGCPECRTLLQEVVETADERLVVRALEAHAPRGGIADGVVRRIRAGDPGSQAPAPVVEDEDDEFLPAARYGGNNPRGRSGMGMMIEYCLKCRERIDPADFRNGTAIQWKGQSFCGNCKAEVLPKLEQDPAFVAAQKAAARPGSGRHEASGGERAGTGRRPRSEMLAPQGPNVKLVVGIGGGVAAVALIGAIVMTMGPSASTNTQPPVKPPTTGVSGRPVKPGGGKPPSGPAAPVPVASTDLSPAVEAKLLGIGERLNSRLATVRKFASENEMQFEEIELKYKTYLEEDEWKDADVQKYEKLQKLRAEVESERRRHQERLQALVNDEVGKAISRALAFADRGEFGTAFRQLDSVPRGLLAASEEARKRIAATRDEIERKQKTVVGDFAMGQWNVLCEGKVDARWIMGGAGHSITHDEAEGAMVISAGPQQGGLLIFNAPRRETWADYEVEMVIKVDDKVQFGMRLVQNPNTGGYDGAVGQFDAEDAKAFHTYRFKVEGDAMTIEQEGKPPIQIAARVKRGFPAFAVGPGKKVALKAFKVRVTKVLG